MNQDIYETIYNEKKTPLEKQKLMWKIFAKHSSLEAIFEEKKNEDNDESDDSEDEIFFEHPSKLL